MDSEERVLFLLSLLLLLPWGNSESVSDGATPRMLSTSSNLNVIEGSSVLLPCNILNLERRVRIWKHLPSRLLFSGSVLVSKDPKISLINGSSLQIDDISPEYSGEYACFVSHHLFLNVTHRLNVLVPPLVVQDPPNGKVVVRKGNSVTMTCNVTGFPKPVVTWSYDVKNVHLWSNARGIRQVDGYQLHMDSVESYHSGKYTCRADNDVGKPVEATFDLTVLYAPKVTVSPEWVHADEGATVELVCTSTGVPLAQASWVRGDQKQNHPLEPDDRIRIWETALKPDTTKTFLRIQRMRREDLGGYTCTAKNSVGQTWKTVEVSGLAEPLQVRGNESGENSFLLLWTTKSYSPVLEYQLRIRKHKSGNEWTDVMIPVSEDSLPQALFFSQSYNVTGLETGIRYEVVLQAHNNYGWNRPSDTFYFSIGPVEMLEESTVLTLLPFYDAELDITDPTYLKQDSSSDVLISNSILTILSIIVYMVL